ncbi:unnamed protein product [Closterium sp. NIES-65]|nr:unnamed protein product [Closterium sp. NIES-65]
MTACGERGGGFGSSASDGFGSSASDGFGSSASDGFGSSASDGFGSSASDGSGSSASDGSGSSASDGSGSSVAASKGTPASDGSSTCSCSGTGEQQQRTGGGSGWVIGVKECEPPKEVAAGVEGWRYEEGAVLADVTMQAAQEVLPHVKQALEQMRAGNGGDGDASWLQGLVQHERVCGGMVSADGEKALNEMF